MPAGIKIFLSGLIAGLISFGTAFVALLTALPATSQMTDVSGPALLVAVSGGALSALKDWQAYVATAPNGGAK